MQCGLNIQAHCVPALRRAERNLCRNYNVHNCLLGEYNRFHCGHKRFKTQLRRTWVVSIAGWVRKEVVSLCVRAASVITQLGAFSLQFRSRSSSVFVARWRSGLTIALCSPFHSHSGISQHVSQKKRYNFSDSDATRRPWGFCAFSMFMFIGEHVQGVLWAPFPRYVVINSGILLRFLLSVFIMRSTAVFTYADVHSFYTNSNKLSCNFAFVWSSTCNRRSGFLLKACMPCQRFYLFRPAVGQSPDCGIY